LGDGRRNFLYKMHPHETQFSIGATRTERERYIYIHMYTYIQTDIQTDRPTDILTDRQTDRPTDILTYKHTYRQTYRQTYGHTIQIKYNRVQIQMQYSTKQIQMQYSTIQIQIQYSTIQYTTLHTYLLHFGGSRIFFDVRMGLLDHVGSNPNWVPKKRGASSSSML
jgi:hypothetical protein